jgi:hypothetical protein
MTQNAVEVLVVCGAPGTGKTATGWEIGHQLEQLGVRHAILDTDELDRVWPQPESVQDLITITHRNLRAFWESYADLDLRHLVLCGVMASISLNEPWITEAIKGSSVILVRLLAGRATREERLRRRELGSGFDKDMRGSDRASSFIADNDPPGMLAVETDGKDVVRVAQEVLLVAGWTT